MLEKSFNKKVQNGMLCHSLGGAVWRLLFGDYLGLNFLDLVKKNSRLVI